MVEQFNQEDFERLKHEVEALVGRTIKSPKDFEFLTCQILGYTSEIISMSTLKRIGDTWLLPANQAHIISISSPAWWAIPTGNRS